MAYTADYDKFKFPENAFKGKRVLITGSGKDGGIGQGLALAAAANGAEVVGVHFHSSYRDGFDMVDAMRANGVKAFAMQADVTLKQNQLWFLRRAESEADQLRVRAEADKAVNELEGRVADLRHIEADLETIRQAHYAAGDQVNQAQGRLYEASAEVGRLEAEIRFVVEGRQRVEHRLAQLREQAAQWAARRQDAEVETTTLAGQAAQAQEKAVMLAAQVEDQAQVLPDLEESLRLAQSRANEQRSSVSQVQQQIQVLAADQRNIEEQWRQFTTRSERLGADRNALAAPDEQRLLNLQGQLAAANDAAETADARLHELQDQVPKLDDERRGRQQAVNAESSRQAALSARLEALKALQEKVRTDGKLKPWLARHGLDALQGLWSRIHVEPGWENALEAALRRTPCTSSVLP